MRRRSAASAASASTSSSGARRPCRRDLPLSLLRLLLLLLPLPLPLLLRRDPPPPAACRVMTPSTRRARRQRLVGLRGRARAGSAAPSRPVVRDSRSLEVLWGSGDDDARRQRVAGQPGGRAAAGLTAGRGG
mmetsp:Transcript_19187/g.61419  ORF Transcript_19187/g.61419 Transcript_19187/m.61419 type:complete len:132 (+) Transcript_19187:1666-2061(+)